MYTIVPGIKIPVVFCSLADYDCLPADLQMRSKKLAIMSGGFAIISLTAEHIDVCKAMPEFANFPGIDKLVPGPAISVLKDVALLMTEEQIMAILAHEDGHYIHGHLSEGAEHQPMVEGTKIINNIEYEFQADEHSALIFGASTMASALTAAIEACFIVLADLFPDKAEVIRKAGKQALLEEQYLARIARLQAM